MKYDKMLNERKNHFCEIERQLEDTLLKLQKEGYLHITVNQLAESAGVARSTVYYHKEVYKKLCAYNDKKFAEDDQ